MLTEPLLSTHPQYYSHTALLDSSALMSLQKQKKTNSVAFSPHAKYTDSAVANFGETSANMFCRGVSHG
jgi:hypothetical protein